ncbi:MAG: hypothetical protein NTW33_00370, partial [Methanoregula sp.]|nr:hypothetical protein [Methanoregula sp.]
MTDDVAVQPVNAAPVPDMNEIQVEKSLVEKCEEGLLFLSSPRPDPDEKYQDVDRDRLIKHAIFSLLEENTVRNEILKKITKLNKNSFVNPLKMDAISLRVTEVTGEFNAIKDEERRQAVAEREAEEIAFQKQRLQKLDANQKNKPVDIIKVKADQILSKGDPVKSIMDEVNRIHKGDEAQKMFVIASEGCKMCSNTDGLHVDLTGDSGKGKSFLLLAMFHQLPDRYKKLNSGSKKALYYSGLIQKTTIFIDDIETLDGDTERIIKIKATTYQEKFIYEVADPRSPTKLSSYEIPERVNFWITSAENTKNVQVLNRSIALTPDASSNQDIEVYENQVKLAKSGKYSFDMTEETKVNRKMLEILLDEDA